jgi:hypothetical protein
MTFQRPDFFPKDLSNAEAFSFIPRLTFLFWFRFLISPIGNLHFELVQLRSFQSFFIKYLSIFIVYRKECQVFADPKLIYCNRTKTGHKVSSKLLAYPILNLAIKEIPFH